MPVVHRYVDGRGYYIKARFQNTMTTYQVSPGGETYLGSRGYGDGSILSPNELMYMKDMGYAFTGQSGAGEVDVETLEPEELQAEPFYYQPTGLQELLARIEEDQRQLERMRRDLKTKRPVLRPQGDSFARPTNVSEPPVGLRQRLPNLIISVVIVIVCLTLLVFALYLTE